MKVMILAAGRGERMRPLTDHTPKPLLEVGSESLIERHLRRLAAHGANEVIINLSWLGEKIRETLGDGNNRGLDIQYIDESDNMLGTGGGVFNALPRLGVEPFMVINADVWTDYCSLDNPLTRDDLAHLVLVDNPPHHAGGDFHLSATRLRNSGQPRLTFSGIGYYRPGFFAGCRPGNFALAPLMRAAADADRISAEHYNGAWFDVGTPERLAELRARIEN